ncbi:MAG: F0F1 ATP synthase subunit B [Phycisphaeraceae bacterium]|jgi:F-type H+-transporting ATPase subunit b|nr:F0F1 ATP synthase subunit B [Phycisphaeraceae bacterium]
MTWMSLTRIAITGAAALALMPAVALAADDGNNLFAGTLLQSLAAIIAFVILLVVLRKFAWGPILSGLQDREAKIKGDLEEAEKAANEANATLTEYKAKLADAQEQARAMIDQSRGDAQRVAAEIKDDTQNEINQMKERAQQDIGAAKEQALGEIYQQTAALATDVAGRILQRQIDETDQQRLVDESLGQLKRGD